MSRFRIGDATVTLRYVRTTDERWARDVYAGTVAVDDGPSWAFDDLSLPAGADEQRAAGDAVGFACAYTDGNRDDAPDWAPLASVANAIEEATCCAQDDHGDYTVEACE